MKFTMSNSPQTDVTFRAEIDRDGDLMLYANGRRLLFIPCRSGTLCRVLVTDKIRELLPGLKFNAGGCIAVSV